MTKQRKNKESKKITIDTLASSGNSSSFVFLIFAIVSLILKEISTIDKHTQYHTKASENENMTEVYGGYLAQILFANKNTATYQKQLSIGKEIANVFL